MSEADDELEYDVCLTFAGEDRGYVEPIANRLREAGIRVFYDDFNKGELWGEDLYVFLDEVFRKKARFAVVFISRHYVSKHWPTHEAKSAQARALLQDTAYFLPVRLDDSDLPGPRPTVGYIDARDTGREKLIEILIEKLGANIPIDRVPRSEQEEVRLLATRPPAWEYLLFGSVLLRRKAELEPTWHDHEVGYTTPSGPRLDAEAAVDRLGGVFDEAVQIVENFNRILTPESQEKAFGVPGEAGDPARIRNLATRLMHVYGELLAWAARIRGANVPEEFGEAFRLASSLSDAAIEEIRDFVDRTVGALDAIPAQLREGTSSITLTLEVTLIVRDEQQRAFQDELERLGRELSL